MTTANSTKAFVGRPALAARLMEAGATGEQIVNPWNPSKTGWLFPVDSTSAPIVQAFYDEIERPLPAAWKKFLQAEGRC